MLKIFKEVEVSHNTNFETKEHYLAFRAAWSDFINSGKAKKTMDEYGTKYSHLRAEHHLLYALLRNKCIDKAFNVTTQGYIDAYRILSFAKKPGSIHTREKLLKPFNGTVTMEMLQKVQI